MRAALADIALKAQLLMHLKTDDTVLDVGSNEFLTAELSEASAPCAPAYSRDAYRDVL